MGQSLSRVYLHIIFGTKNWEPSIQPAIENELYSYLAGVCHHLDCATLSVNGHLNHVHILSRLSKTITIAELLQKLKSNSSKWMKTKDEDIKHFSWQDGYAAFSVSESALASVSQYINQQKEHHKIIGYKDEIRNLLRENGIEIDEKYFWR
ncbi:MAG: IS200/IS605 family transposase [Cryomorphaceae bacterium]